MSLLNATAACSSRGYLKCEQDSHCDVAGGGVCSDPGTGNHWCSYPDPRCPSGYRYSDIQVGDGVSGSCVVRTGGDAGADGAIPLQDWVNHYGGAGSELAQSLAVASNGDIITTGRFNGASNLGGATLTPHGVTDLWVARYRADGSPLWSTNFGGAGIDFATSVSVDAAGDVYLGGRFSDAVDFGGGVRVAAGTGSFLLKLDGKNGAYEWDRTLGLSVASHAGAVAIVPLDEDTIVVGGYFVGSVDFGKGLISSQSPEGSDSFVAAYDASTGGLKWLRPITATRDAGGFGGLAVASGDVFVTGGFSGRMDLGGGILGAAGSKDIFMVRYHGSDGAHVWSIRDGGEHDESTLGGQSLTISDSHIIVGGLFDTSTTMALQPLSSAGSLDGFVAEYNIADGSPVWARQLGGSAADKVVAVTSGVDRVTVGLSFSGEITVAGQVLRAAGGASSTDVAIVRLSPGAGTPLLAAQLADTETVSLAYAASRLVGLGSFVGSTGFLGSSLISQGMDDILMFSVSF